MHVGAVHHGLDLIYSLKDSLPTLVINSLSPQNISIQGKIYEVSRDITLIVLL